MAEDDSTRMSQERSTSDAQLRTRRRNRIITSCLECRRRKLRCDRLHPCNHCVKGGRDCVFLAPAKDPVSKDKLNHFKQSMEALEKELETVVDEGSTSGWRLTSGVSNTTSTATQIDLDIPEDERSLEPTPLALASIAYADDGNDTFDDLGVQFGRMRLTERIGGYVRPALADEFSEVIRTNKPAKFNDSSASPYSSTASPSSMDSQSRSAYLEPSASYVAPGASLLFAGGSMEDASLLDYLPSREFADEMMEQYWEAVHPLIHLVHRRSFENSYQTFWQAVTAGYEPPGSNQALIFAALFSAAISLPDSLGQQRSGFGKRDVIKTFQAGCEYALIRANFMRTSKVETIQALALYLSPMCRAEMSRSHCALISATVRLAYMAGLHKDGTIYGLSAVHVHVRRLVWHHLIVLDVRSFEAMGPPAQIRATDYDTKIPLNANDSDFDGFMPPSKDADCWTDVTFSNIKIECAAHRYRLYEDLLLLQNKQMTIHAILRNIEEFRDRMEKRYMPLIDESIPIQAYAARIIRLYRYKAHIFVLNRFVLFAPQACPERLRDIIWSSGLAYTEISIELETSQRFRVWAWYSGAYQQYHQAILLLSEVTRCPNRPETDRIWNCLDWVFDAPQYLSRKEKSNYIVGTAVARLEEYKRYRRHTLPLDLRNRLGANASASASIRSAIPLPNPSIGAHRSDPDPPMRPLPDRQSRSPLGTTSPFQAASPDWYTNIEQSELASPPVPSRDMAYDQILSTLPGMASQPLEPLQMYTNTMLNGPNPVNPPVQALPPGNSTGFFDGMDVDWDEIDRLFPMQQQTVGGDTTEGSKDLSDFTMPYTSQYVSPLLLPNTGNPTR